MKENLGAVEISFTSAELTEFRNELENIELIGVREPASALVDA